MSKGTGGVTVDDAAKLLKQLERGDLSPDEAYARLTRNDSDTLTLLNRVVSMAPRKDPPVYTLGLDELVLRCVNAWRDAVVELSDPGNATWAGIRRVLWRGERRMFLGVLLVLVSLAAYFVDVTL